MTAEISKAILAGNRRAIARFISKIENNAPDTPEILSELAPYTGKALILGITGSTGVGKSTLINELAKCYRSRGKTIGILAIDPTSPYTGGAILGDRIRFQDLSGDNGIFMRSMATRGMMGGLSRATNEAIDVLDAAGFDLIFVETAGTGQAEVEVAHLAHTVLVVLTPGSGDDIQALKAGIMEIADIYVLNKSDREGADGAFASLEAVLMMAEELEFQRYEGIPGEMTVPQPEKRYPQKWHPPIIRLVAFSGEGIEELAEAIESHQAHLQSSHEKKERERQRLLYEVESILKEDIMQRLMSRLTRESLYKLLDRLENRQIGPHQAANELFAVIISSPFSG